MEHPAYYSVIPAEIRYSNKISLLAKLLYGEITALCNKEGFCWATNKYFAEIYGKSETQISTTIRQLEKAGFIFIDLEQNYKRKIWLIPPQENLKPPLRKLKTPPQENLKHNNIINNINNTFTKVKDNSEYGNPEINLIIDVFKDCFNVNMTKVNLNRYAAKRLIDKYGVDKVIKLIEFAYKIQGKPYAPTINNILDIEQKMVSIMNFYAKNKGGIRGKRI